jgi:hypothetical protein
MFVKLTDLLNKLLEKLGEELDIPDHIYEDAVLKFESVGEWLQAEDSCLLSYSPEIFPQGSFRLGTVVRPIDDYGEYDIDLVCQLKIDKQNVTQKELKEKVGIRLKEHPELRKMLQESRRCWRLDYPHQFHMDVLPAIPNIERMPTGILLTDTDLRYWQKSNPKAYSEWFYERMKEMVTLQKEILLDNDIAYKGIEEVPEWKVRTPLQRAVQILKRHRDVYFAHDRENCPVSIIITTLAAKAYGNQTSVLDAIIDLVQDMPNHIEIRDGKWWVENPVEPNENFADKWNEKPERREAFLRWLRSVQQDFHDAYRSPTIKKASSLLGNNLGLSDVRRAAKALGISDSDQASISRKTAPQVPPLGDEWHVLPLPEPVRERYKVTLSGTVHSKSGKKLWILSSRPVPKDVRILFRVNTTAPEPYTVKWQVANTGLEAGQAQQLRGDFYFSDSGEPNSRWESTSFLGTHWVEAFIVKDGICVARSGRKYIKVR